MRIGILGLGSIGQRHAMCLEKIGVSDVLALRTKKGTSKGLPEELKHVKEVFSEEELYSLNIDGVIISNPTSLHVESMKTSLEKGIPIFVEKPVATSCAEAGMLEGFDKSKVMVGHNFRYNDVVRNIKEFIDSNRLGRVLKANLYCGQYLPDWHPYADYRTEYYSRKDLGGGVIRTLSHEIDIMHYLFGPVKELCASVEKISDLEIDVDDNAFLSCRTEGGALVNIELDYLNPTLERHGTIFGSLGKLDYSLSKPSTKFTGNDGNVFEIFRNENLDSNSMYTTQMESFINMIKTNEKPVCSYTDGINVLKVIEASEKSTLEKCWVDVP